MVSVGYKQVSSDLLMFVSNVQLHRNGDAMHNSKKEIIFWLDVCEKGIERMAEFFRR